MNHPVIHPLELRGVSGACSDGTCIRGVSTAFAAGRLHLLRGPSGSGRSALFRFAGLLERPEEGEVLIHGAGTGPLADEARTELRAQRLGFAFTAPFLLSAFTVIENVAMPLFKVSQVDPEEARRRTEAMLQFVGLGAVVEAPVDELDTHAQYRVAIARGLVNEPAALLVEDLDGVLAGGDLEDFTDLLRRAAATYGPAILATTSPDCKMLPGDRVLDIDGGVITRDSECLPEACG